MEACSEKDVGVGEETFLERDDDELGPFEACTEELSNVLGM